MRYAATRIAGLMLALLLAAASGYGQGASPSKDQLKAAFLYHFAQFVGWPPASFPDATSPLFIGILGESPLRGELERTLSGKSINNHPLKVRPIRVPADATNACHVLFISSSETKHVPEIIAALREAKASVLTVGDEIERFTERGGMINFVQESSKIRFQINAAAAENAGLKISSKLLSLAFKPSG